ncbi:MAG: SDR family NAD(P)-dependent oxidoreductase, partial [Calditrichaeota bacterium]|nr:SDR family NAD(P)-dependent oxidoreductase [Calditrichota bacterium]
MKWVIVTGDSRGLGAEISKHILEKTACGVIGISRSIKRIREGVNLPPSERYIQLQYDLSKPEGIKNLYQGSIKPIGPIIGLVNNAAFAYDDLATNMNADLVRGMYDVNLFSPIMLTKYIIRDFILHKTQGAIVNITSVCAHTGYKGLSVYASSKGALEAYSRTIAREWGRYGIRSNCVAPGFMETEMSSNLNE